MFCSNYEHRCSLLSIFALFMGLLIARLDDCSMHRLNSICLCRALWSIVSMIVACISWIAYVWTLWSIAYTIVACIGDISVYTHTCIHIFIQSSMIGCLDHWSMHTLNCICSCFVHLCMHTFACCLQSFWALWSIDWTIVACVDWIAYVYAEPYDRLFGWL